MIGSDAEKLAPQAFSTLIEAFKNEVWPKAVRALKKIGPKAVPALI